MKTRWQDLIRKHWAGEVLADPFLIGHWYYNFFCYLRNDLFQQVLIRSLQFPVRLVFPYQMLSL